jgi:hypothetical protein
MYLLMVKVTTSQTGLIPLKILISNNAASREPTKSESRRYVWH